MNNLKDINRRVRSLIDQYSENGEIILVEDTFYADGDLKFNEVVDQVQRKICVTSKKIIEHIPLVMRAPRITAPADINTGNNIGTEAANQELSIPEKSAAYIKIPVNSKTFSFVLDAETDANIKVEVYSFPKNAANISDLDLYQFGVPYLTALDLSGASKCENESFEFISEQSLSLASGYLPSDINNSTEFAAFVLKIIADDNYAAVVSKFAAYENFFGEKAMIPEKGYMTAKLPNDIIELLSIKKEKQSGGIQADLSGVILSKNNNILTVPIEKSGVYTVTYYRYPKRIALDSPEDTEVELDDYAVDALIFGVAAIICPIENVAIIARMTSLFEEAMRNIYNTDKSFNRIGNKVYQPRKFKLNDLY